MNAPPFKGQSVPLNVTQEAKQRIFVGLGWNPNEKPGLGDKLGALIGAREHYHDLDLSCFYFDAQKNCLGAVTADPNSYSDPSGCIYHSGDNVEGIGDGDDEQISVELKDLPQNIETIIFKASIKSGHHFNEIADPSIRLCDGYTGHCFLESSLNSETAEKSDAYVFISLKREGDGWHMRYIGEFLKNEPLERMKNTLGGYTR